MATTMKIVFILCLFLGVSGFGVSSDNLATADHQQATETSELFDEVKVNEDEFGQKDVSSELIDEQEFSETGNPRVARSSNSNKPPNRPNDMASGSVYVRWGHTECPEYSTLVYPGVAAGSSWGSAGGGTNTLCLPHDPVYDSPVAGVGTSRAALYAVEYQIDSFPLRNSREWHDVPCAVCKAPRSVQLMVPGKNVCPSDNWTWEYSGYLMAERTRSNHKRSTFICVDRSMRTVTRTDGNGRYRGSLDLVESMCISSGGGLPCGPYRDGYELTCAVCTQ